MNQTTEVGPSPDDIRAQLQRILESPLFSGARRLSQFLQFVVDRSIDGQAGEIKESLIGVEVYKRSPSYDPKADSIVRAEASRLRAKLREYYESLGKDDAIRIDVPKGSYTPVFRLLAASVVSEPIPPPESPPKAKVQWPWIAATAGLLLVAVTAAFWGPVHGARKVHSIAVMPPVNLGQDHKNDALSDSLADGITSALVDSADWKVVGRAPTVDQSGQDQMLAWLRKNLHADYVITGSYHVGENSNVRLSLQVVNVEDGRLVWTQTYHRGLSELADSEKELARVLVGDITEKTRDPVARTTRSPANQVARSRYLKARELWSQRSGQGWLDSLPLFRESVQADSEFAPAWAGLADANMHLVEGRNEPVATRVAEARNAALKAIQLDESNAEAHAALGWIFAFEDWNFEEGSQQLARAVALDPIRVFPNIYYSQALAVLGRFADAQAAVEAAHARLPQIPEVVFQQGSVFFLGRQSERLEALGRELLALQPAGAPGHWLVGLSLEQRGQAARAIAEFQSGLLQQPKDLRTLCALSHAYGLVGNHAQALATARRFIDFDQKEITPFTLSYCAALTYTGMGQRDKAFEWLDKARIGRDNSFPFFPHDPRFDPLKSDPRFERLANSLKNGGKL